MSKSKKLTKAELDFIDKYGMRNYELALKLIPELKDEPRAFKYIDKLICLEEEEEEFPPKIWKLFNEWIDAHPEEFEDEYYKDEEDEEVQQ